MSKFQGLLHKKEDGTITGPMSPLLAAKAFSQQMEQPYNGLVRYRYGQNYDNLIMRQKYNNAVLYCMFIDMGVSYLPVGLWVSDGKDKEATITPLYLKELERMDDHYSNCELDKGYDDPPLPTFDKDTLVALNQRQV